MKSKGAQEFPKGRRVISAANEEFSGAVSAIRAAQAQSGWDPYEVWLTRVKAPALLKREPQRDPLGQS
jgi:hypothetical protein